MATTRSGAGCGRPSRRWTIASRSSARLERPDGNVVDCATMPLPDGATLVTFQDVTDTVNVERALRERNEALETADRLKIDFVHHVSYELRSPLTNIIGFAHFLGRPRHRAADREAARISRATSRCRPNALLAIINDILDLATIDAGAMTLNLGSVDIRRTDGSGRRGRAGPTRRRTASGSKSAPRPTSAASSPTSGACARSLFNLLANAVGFSPPGETVTLRRSTAQGCRRVLGDRSRPRHPGRRAGQGVRLVRDPLARLAPPRHGPRPLDRALLRRAAWRLR